MADFPTPPFFEAPARRNPLEFLEETYSAKRHISRKPTKHGKKRKKSQSHDFLDFEKKRKT